MWTSTTVEAPSVVLTCAIYDSNLMYSWCCRTGPQEKCWEVEDSGQQCWRRRWWRRQQRRDECGQAGGPGCVQDRAAAGHLDPVRAVRQELQPQENKRALAGESGLWVTRLQQDGFNLRSTHQWTRLTFPFFLSFFQPPPNSSWTRAPPARL